MDKVAKTVKIGNLTFSVNVPSDQIQIYDNAEKRANNILNSSSEKHEKASREGLLSMTILQLAVDLESSLENNRKSEQKASDMADSVADFIKNIGKKDVQGL